MNWNARRTSCRVLVGIHVSKAGWYYNFRVSLSASTDASYLANILDNMRIMSSLSRYGFSQVKWFATDAQGPFLT